MFGKTFTKLFAVFEIALSTAGMALGAVNNDGYLIGASVFVFMVFSATLLYLETPK